MHMAWVDVLAVALAAGIAGGRQPEEWRGLEAELAAALARAHSTGATQAPSDVVRQVLETSLRLDAEGTFEDLRWLSRDAQALRGALVEALGASADDRGFAWIAEQMSDPALVDAALVELTRLGGRASHAARVDAAARVREHLSAADPSRRRLARAAAIALVDEGAVPVWISALDTADEAERAQLALALARVTGVTRAMGDDQATWARWLTDELAWSAARAAGALRDLEHHDPAVVVSAIRALSERSYQRDRFAAAIGEAASTSRHATVRSQACLALQRLGSRAGERALRVLAERDRDATVRTAANHALTTLR